MCLYKYTEKQVDEFFHTWDANRDNVLSVAEFAKWMQAMPEVGDELIGASTAYWESTKRRPSFKDSSQLSKSEREAIVSYLERFQNTRLHEAEVVRREMEVKRITDEKYLAERQAELEREKERFAKKYGKEAQQSSAKKK